MDRTVSVDGRSRTLVNPLFLGRLHHGATAVRGGGACWAVASSSLAVRLRRSLAAACALGGACLR